MTHPEELRLWRRLIVRVRAIVQGVRGSPTPVRLAGGIGFYLGMRSAALAKA